LRGARLFLFLAVPAAAALLGSCCGAFQSDDSKYKKAIECADRITDERSLEILRKGEFCCAPVPPDVKDRPAAKRFYLEQARRLKPDAPEPLLAIAMTYWDEADYAGALEAYDEAIKLDPKPVMAVIGAFTMDRLLGRWDEAAERVKWIRGQKGIDAEKVGDYLEARLLYDQGRYADAEPLFRRAIERSERSDVSLGPTPYTLKDAHFYLAQIRLKAGDPQGAHQEFLAFLKKMSDPDFQVWYAYWVPRMGSQQAEFYAKVEQDWVRVRQ
jgi:tetratricopeptide (TPR) repeat protein